MGSNKRNMHFPIQTIFYVFFFFNLISYITAISVSVKSEIVGEGFHRTLKYHVDTGNFKNNSCHLALFLDLPQSIYVNVDELADLRRHSNSTACSEGEIDVELFAERASNQNVTICSRLTSSKKTLSIPIHQRYHLASPTNEIINVIFPQPKLLIGCRDRLKEHRVSRTFICWPCIEYSKKWRDVNYKWGGDDNFVWQIPVGNTSQRFLVNCVTLLVTTLCSAYVLKKIYESYNKISKDK